jgi:hypothetical protein
MAVYPPDRNRGKTRHPGTDRIPVWNQAPNLSVSRFVDGTYPDSDVNHRADAVNSPFALSSE